MIFFGIDIRDGKPQKQMYLDDNLPLEEQWVHLTQNVASIEYFVKDFEFSIDVGWYPSAEVTPDAFFKTIVIEGPVTEGGIFFISRSRSIGDLKKDISAAVDLIENLKGKDRDQIIASKLDEEP